MTVWGILEKQVNSMLLNNAVLAYADAAFIHF
ncbi:hypothetical protein M2454_003075 [Aequitasia blattaphilus]